MDPELRAMVKAEIDRSENVRLADERHGNYQWSGVIARGDLQDYRLARIYPQEDATHE